MNKIRLKCCWHKQVLNWTHVKTNKDVRSSGLYSVVVWWFVSMFVIKFIYSI